MHRETNSNQRILEILRMLFEQPRHYTKKDWAKMYGTSQKTIQNDFRDLENAGFCLDFDKNFRYFIVADKTAVKIEDLLILTTTEQEILLNLLNKAIQPPKTIKAILGKLENLQLLPRLGNTYFSRNYLQKLHVLQEAIRLKKQVLLKDYRSTNSNTRHDRAIEPFHIVVEDDILHAVACNSKEVRHFRLSRIENLQLLETAWQYETKHLIYATDIFRITDKNQEKVHIRLKIGGVNELLERYPLSKMYIHEVAGEEGIYDLQCPVNSNFYGLQNFLLGYAHYVVEILESKRLKAHMQEYLKEHSKIFN